MCKMILAPQLPSSMATRYIARELLVKAVLSISAALAINTLNRMHHKHVCQQNRKVDFKQINE